METKTEIEKAVIVFLFVREAEARAHRATVELPAPPEVLEALRLKRMPEAA